MGKLGRLGRMLKRALRRYPELDEALRNYCKQKGIKLEDAMASAVSMYLSADEEGRDQLEAALMELKGRRGGNQVDSLVQALELVEKLMGVTTNMMTSVYEAGQRLVRASLLSEIKGTMETVKEIKQIGEEGGKGSIEDLISQMILASMMSRIGVPPQSLRAERRRTGAGKVEELEE